MPKVDTLTERAARIEVFMREARERGTVRGRSGKMIEFGKTPIRPEQDKTLVDAVLQEKPHRVIETGFAYGFSAMIFVKTMLEMGVEAPYSVSIDPRQSGSALDDAGVLACEDVGISEFVKLYTDGSEYTLPRLIQEGETFDMGFVDGCHLFELAFMDIFFMNRLIKPGGLILVDDMWMPSVRAAVDYGVKNLGLVHENRIEPKRRLFGRGSSKSLDVTKTAQQPTALLRVPSKPIERNWDHYADFTPNW